MVTAIIQARTGSTRLPNKIFINIVGKPLILHIVNRIKACQFVDEIIIATTINPKDDIVENWGNENGVKVFRGSENDVLDRFYQAAKYYGSKIIVRVTADDPFKDSGVIDSVVKFFEDNALDFAYNNSPPSFPEGIDTEVFSFAALEKAKLNAVNPFDLEHVTQYFYKNPGMFKQANFPYYKDISYLRWTIDTEPDLRMAEEIYKELYKEGETFLMDDILKLLENRPDLKEINRNVERSTMYKKDK